METSDDQTCCPKFDPIPWDNVNFDWNDKRFVKSSVCTFFYMPLNFGSVMKKMDKKISEAGADWSEGICLATTCPKCAKKYGKNYVVLMAKVG